MKNILFIVILLISSSYATAKPFDVTCVHDSLFWKVVWDSKVLVIEQDTLGGRKRYAYEVKSSKEEYFNGKYFAITFVYFENEKEFLVRYSATGDKIQVQNASVDKNGFLKYASSKHVKNCSIKTGK